MKSIAYRDNVKCGSGALSVFWLTCVSYARHFVQNSSEKCQSGGIKSSCAGVVIISKAETNKWKSPYAEEEQYNILKYDVSDQQKQMHQTTSRRYYRNARNTRVEIS